MKYCYFLRNSIKLFQFLSCLIEFKQKTRAINLAYVFSSHTKNNHRGTQKTFARVEVTEAKYLYQQFNLLTTDAQIFSLWTDVEPSESETKPSFHFCANFAGNFFEVFIMREKFSLTFSWVFRKCFAAHVSSVIRSKQLLSEKT